MNQPMNVIAGLDIGNGYVKGRAGAFGVAPTNIDMPSCAAMVTTSHNIETPDSDIPSAIDNIFNVMDAAFESHMVRHRNRRLFGRRGIDSGKHLDEFNVSSNHQSKAKKDLSAVLVLGCVAGKALQDYWAAYHALPDPNDVITVHARVALALPINEFIAYRTEYANNYRKASHMVTIYNFATPVKFQVVFDDVQVIAEGAAAQYAILNGGVPLMNSLLEDLKKMENIMPGIQARMANITAEAVLGAKRIIGIDIGEGTVNFPVMNGKSLDNDVSTSMDKGYGMVLSEALKRLKASGFAFNNRKGLTEFLNDGPTAINQELYKATQFVVEDEIDGFVAEIDMQFQDIMGQIGTTTDVVYVYGGGATPVRRKLYPLLLQASQNFGGISMSCPILYLDSRYSRNLNRNGLYLMADGVAKRAAEAAAAQQTAQQSQAPKA